MTSKIVFSLKFIGLNGVLILLLLVLQTLNVISFPSKQFYFIIASSLLILLFSITVILPAIGGKKESFVLQFMILTVMQLLLMLSVSTYEIYVWGKIATEAILFQLVPFIWILVTQTFLLYRYSLKSQ
jgi:hypothetical protein